MSLWLEWWFNSKNTIETRTFFLCLSLYTGLLLALRSVLLRFQFITSNAICISDNQLYNSIITTHTIIMILFMVIPAIIGGFGSFLLPLFVGGPNTTSTKLNNILLFRINIEFVKYRIFGIGVVFLLVLTTLHFFNYEVYVNYYTIRLLWLTAFRYSYLIGDVFSVLIIRTIMLIGLIAALYLSGIFFFFTQLWC